MLDCLVKKRDIAPDVPGFDKLGPKHRSFELADVNYDVPEHVNVCPGDKEVRHLRRAYSEPREARHDEDGILRYRASKTDCDTCALKLSCCRQETSREFTRSV